MKFMIILFLLACIWLFASSFMIAKLAKTMSLHERGITAIIDDTRKQQEALAKSAQDLQEVRGCCLTNESAISDLKGRGKGRHKKAI